MFNYTVFQHIFVATKRKIKLIIYPLFTCDSLSYICLRSFKYKLEIIQKLNKTQKYIIILIERDILSIRYTATYL